MSYKIYICAFSLIIKYAYCVSNCPSTLPPIDSPCYYDNLDDGCGIICRGESKIDITGTFGKVSAKLPVDRKSFTKLELRNTAIEELPANAFQGIQFKSISILGARSLRRVHRQAFNGTGDTTRQLEFNFAPVTEHVSTIDGWDLFGAIRAIPSLMLVRFTKANITELPTGAVAGMNKLVYFHMWYGVSPLSVASNAFHLLPIIEEIKVGDTRVVGIGDRAFTVGPNPSNRRLTLEFGGDSLTADSFVNKSVFDSIGRPTTVSFDRFNSVKYLNESVFGSFLADNKLNRVIDETIDCADSRNQWVKEKYPDVWYILKCH